MTNLTFSTARTFIRYAYQDESNHNYPATWEANFAWDGRADYLAWVGKWKLRLHEIIKAIREQKAIRRDRSRSIDERQGANTERQLLRVNCYNLLLLRKIAKLRAARQSEQQRLAA